MFILLGRDKNAPSLVDLWARQREIDEEDPAKVREARDRANAMRAFAGACKRRWDIERDPRGARQVLSESSAKVPERES